MKLQLLVCRHNEPESVIAPLFDSLAIQVGVYIAKDIEVIVCDDGSEDRLTNAFLERYPFKVHYWFCQHRGLYATRNECLKHATADYVMFCDADDRFLNVMGLYYIMQEIGKGDFDVLNSKFIEETRTQDTGRLVYVSHDEDHRFVHGKVYRRQFLTDNDLWYNGELKVHGDFYFLIPAWKLSKETRNVKEPFYLWKWRDDSLCRKNKDHEIRTYTNLIDVIELTVQHLLDYGLKDDAQRYATQFVYSTYYKENTELWQRDEYRELREAIRKRFKVFLKKYQLLINGVPDSVEAKIAMETRMGAFSWGVIVERFTMADWLKEVTGD